MICTTETTDWHNCYEDSWKGVITPEAFAHPAKFARGQIERIIDCGLQQGYWKPGNTIGDPFGGVGTGGIVAASRGLRWVGVELENHFVELARRNFAKHRPMWKAAGDPLPMILQGDSREFSRLVSGCDAVVCSPPYAESVKGKHKETETAKQSRNKRKTAGGSLGQSQRHGGYGVGEGQIGAMKEGKLDAAVTSPPYESSLNAGGPDTQNPDGYHRRMRNLKQSYGTTTGQVGNTSGETYWTAMETVYWQLHLAVKPYGVAAIVVKDYVKNKRRVPLCDLTCQLLDSIGFDVFNRTRCWLVKREEHPSLFGGEPIVTTTERKSFFRRLHEAKLSADDPRRIDWEEVIWVRV